MPHFEIMKKFCLERGLPYGDELEKKLRLYGEFLLEYNKKVNLTAIKAPLDIVCKHFCDSALAALEPGKTPPSAETGGRILDVGSGAGFPGVVLKLLYPSRELFLLDSNNKKALFLRLLTQKLEINAEIICARAEDAAKSSEYRESFDLVTARAVAQLRELCEYCLPFVKKGGVFAALKGPGCTEELEEAKRAVKALGGAVKNIAAHVLPDGGARRVIYIEKIKATPPRFPRAFAKITKDPI